MSLNLASQVIVGLVLWSSAASISASPRGRNNIPTILEHKLEWASVEQVDCSSFDVTIRYDCLQDPQSPFPNATEFERVCSELIPEGLKYHYEQTLWLQDSPYQVTIHPQRASEQIQPIVLPYSCGRGSNFLILPAIIPFCNTSLETHFKHTVAHEFGHAIIAANRELFHSLTHKGSSTVLQDSNEHAPHATCDGSVRNDIMHYTGSADPDCYGPNGRKNDAYYLNGFLTEADLQGLVMDAMFQDEDTLCGSGLGSNCTMIQPQSCLPGLLCSPDLRCVECVEDSSCGGDQFCYGTNSTLIHATKCVDRQLGGTVCHRHSQCQSGSCSEGFCSD